MTVKSLRNQRHFWRSQRGIFKKLKPFVGCDQLSKNFGRFQAEVFVGQRSSKRFQWENGRD